MKGARLLIKELEAQGVDHIFGYPGGAIMPVYDALYDSQIEHVLTRHEQGAALAAGGYARISGRVGVCLATSGPGATNLVTGIADAYMDSIPLVAITGQVPTPVMGTDAFQEVDIFSITLPVVKHSWIVRDIHDLPRIVREAFRIARSGRPGPVLIDLPKDLTITTVGDLPEIEPPCEVPHAPSRQSLEAASRLLAQAERPVIIAGGGIYHSQATDLFRAFVDRQRIPTVTTLHGIGTLPTAHDLSLGMLGMHGNRAANLSVQESDVLVCLGMRFDDRVTGKLDAFAPNAAVIHVDIDASELGKLRRPQAPVRADMSAALAQWSPSPADCSPWRELCLERKSTHAHRYQPDETDIDAPDFLRRMTEADPAYWTLTSDVGQHQMWVAQHAHFDRPEQFATSGGLGTMGFGVPAAIGMQFACPDANIAVITGDGSLMMNVQELATIRRYELPIKIVVFDNSSLGLVRQWQECFFKSRYSEIDLSDNPDFGHVAESFGIPSIRVDSQHEVGRALEAMRMTEGPVLVHVPIDQAAKVWPLVPPNASNSEMIDGVPA